MFRGAVAIFRRDFRKFLSTPFVLFMTLLFPLVYLVVFGNAIGGTITGIPIGVVQEEPYTGTSAVYDAGVAALRDYHQQDKAAQFRVTAYTSEEIARDALSRSEISGYVVFPSGISPGRDIRLYVDSSDYMVPSLVQGGVGAVVAGLRVPNGLMTENIYGTIEYLQFFGVGVIVMAIFMTTMMGGGIALIRDREMGITEGYFVTPVKRSSVILGMIGSGTLRAFLAGFIIFIVDIVVAGVIVRSAGDFFLVLVVLLITSVGISSIVIALSSRFATQQEYASSVAFLNFLLFMTSGAFYPVIGMPSWLSWITVINPEAYAIHALRSIILRGQGITVIGTDLAALAIFSAAGIIIGIVTFRRTLE